jgi:DNA adenine methylase
MTKVKPFVKWAGGKRNISDTLRSMFPPKDDYDVYVEPFVGGGAIFFSNSHKEAVISDTNKELYLAYAAIASDVEKLIENLRILKEMNTKEHYLSIRSLDTKKMTETERAARLIYLNWTCFNGMYRVNSKGQYNTAYGNYKNPAICDETNLRAVSEYLNSNQVYIYNLDFRAILNYGWTRDKRDFDKRAFVYCDPPYLPISNTANFVAYTPDKFDIQDHKTLRWHLGELDKRGVLWGLSMSNTEWAKEQYAEYFVHEIKARRSIAGDGKSRASIKELYITNYESNQETIEAA